MGMREQEDLFLWSSYINWEQKGQNLAVKKTKEMPQEELSENLNSKNL